MDLWTIIPVKPFALGKSRLAPVLSAPERVALNRAMFGHVLGTAIGAFGAARIAVVTADREASAFAAAHGAHVVPEPASTDLDAALALAAGYVGAHGAEALLVLPSDLPHLGPADLTALAETVERTPCCVIAPDRARTGTNALALVPPDASFFRFGPESFAKHCNLADARKLALRIVTRPGLAFDLDTPDDYRACLSGGGPAWLCAAASAPHAAPAR